MYLHYRPVFIETIHVQADTLGANRCVKESNVGMSDEFAKAPSAAVTERFARQLHDRYVLFRPAFSFPVSCFTFHQCLSVASVFSFR